MLDLIFENPSLLLMMEHFDMNIVVRNKTVEQICNENQINQQVFINVANLYNGFNIANTKDIDRSDTESIILFLKNSHRYYLDEKIPEIHDCINGLYAKNNIPEIRLVGRFFDEYSQEVKEHLNYEDVVAFPYFSALANNREHYDSEDKKFSAEEYREHHTDIETKLGELKNLLLKHIPLKQDGSLRRKLLTSLFELEYDLTIHSVIEESILIPLIKKIEKQKKIG
ncbi:hemerythrin domain-containing protein [Maribellus comscasis]|nr:hemerythrin domain-containing protein [Maribellus comscasis]